MRVYQKKRILVVVKTYPNPSRNYGETVCCAGVDLDSGRWVRMYPITFRQLAERQFAKYQLIECSATCRAETSDPRAFGSTRISSRSLVSPCLLDQRAGENYGPAPGALEITRRHPRRSGCRRDQHRHVPTQAD